MYLFPLLPRLMMLVHSRVRLPGRLMVERWALPLTLPMHIQISSLIRLRIDDKKSMYIHTLLSLWWCLDSFKPLRLSWSSTATSDGEWMWWLSFPLLHLDDTIGSNRLGLLLRSSIIIEYDEVDACPRIPTASRLLPTKGVETKADLEIAAPAVTPWHAATAVKIRPDRILLHSEMIVQVEDSPKRFACSPPSTRLEECRQIKLPSKYPVDW